MPTTLSEELPENAVKLHGHLGPFLVLGLKMSLRAERILGGKPEKCVVKTINSKPFLCVLDGIKVRIGNDSVTVREGKSLSARFSKADAKDAVISVKKNLIEKYAKGPWEKNEEYAYEVVQSGDEQLFE
jgi:formylmethanofuran dehydrogenase subunit E